MPNISAFGLRVHQKIFKKCPLFYPFLGVGPFMTPGTLFAQTGISLFQGHASYQISMQSDHWFVRGIFFRYPKFNIVASFRAPEGTSTLICAHFNPHAFPKDTSYQMWLKSVQQFWRMRVLNVFPYISQCKMKHPLVGPFFGRFYFYAQTLRTMSKGCCI